MIQHLEPDQHLSLDDYAAVASLAPAVHSLRAEASILVSSLRGRTVWMVNSTAQGGGVAEMLPRMITILEELGLPTRWVVMETDRPEFFVLTKQLHNLIHGDGEPDLTAGDRELYEAINKRNADELRSSLRPDDLLVIHDPQPMAMAGILREDVGVRTIWRCHIGHDEHLPATRAAWEFLQPYAPAYDLAVFSAPEYIPDFVAGRARIIHPALDPFSHKNRELSPHKLIGVLCNAGLTLQRHPVLTPPFPDQVQRLRPDGEFASVADQEELGLLYRPIVTQISRWDRLKGFRPLLDGFVALKRQLQERADLTDRHRRGLEIVRLVLAGPDPASIQDDPEGQEVLKELSETYCNLDPEQQKDIALLTLPMSSRKENALIVNALQRCSTVIVQNSLREGFGLTATEAMWKRVPILATRASGLRQQVRSGIDGVVVQDATNPREIAKRLDDLLENAWKRDLLARSAQRRVYDEFLIFTQLSQWLRALSAAATGTRQPA